VVSETARGDSPAARYDERSGVDGTGKMFAGFGAGFFLNYFFNGLSFQRDVYHNGSLRVLPARRFSISVVRGSAGRCSV
jgi:hypothetical protein